MLAGRAGHLVGRCGTPFGQDVLGLAQGFVVGTQNAVEQAHNVVGALQHLVMAHVHRFQAQVAQFADAAQKRAQQVLVAFQLQYPWRGDDDVIAGEQEALLAFQQAEVVDGVAGRFQYFQVVAATVEHGAGAHHLHGGDGLVQGIVLPREQGDEGVKPLVAGSGHPGVVHERRHHGGIEGLAGPAHHPACALVQAIGHVAHVVVVQMCQEDIGGLPGRSRFGEQVV